jgi:hypothetical protein
MAGEITYRGKLAYNKDDADSFDLGDLTANMTGTKAQRGRQTCGTTEEALVLGEVPAGSAWFICRNRDITNKLLVAPAAGAAYLIEVQPGETSGPFRFLSTVVAPVVKSSASTVDFTYLLVSA